MITDYETYRQVLLAIIACLLGGGSVIALAVYLISGKISQYRDERRLATVDAVIKRMIQIQAANKQAGASTR